MSVAAGILPFIPLLPRQILLLNFLSDIPAMAISTDAVDPEQLERPHSWDVHSIRNFMIVFGLISSLFDFLTFGVLRLVFNAGPDLFRSGWFVASVATELAVMLVLRTQRPFYRSKPGTGLLVASAAVAAVTICLPFSPAAETLGMTSLTIGIVGSLFAITMGYVVVTELVKRVLPGTMR
jgi:Mg2+-importing ATPase